MKRLNVYVAQTKPLIGYYENWARGGDPSDCLNAPKYKRFSGHGTIDEIRARVLDALK